MSDFPIPLSVPNLKGNEWKYVKDCLDTEWVSSAGKYVDLFEKNIADYTGAKFAVSCVNGSSALQLSLRLAGVQLGDEVIVPTLTFIATVNAIIHNGAVPVFMDADEYYNVDAEKTVEFIRQETVFKKGSSFNKRTGAKITAIIAVHVWGNAAWLDELAPICEERNISVVEDASESLGTRYISGKFLGKHTGTIGMLGCLSFNGNKIITCGGGGMILTDDPELAEKALYLTTQAKDDPVRYIHNEIGYNFRLTNMQAALGLAQLEQLTGFLERKREIFRQYQLAIQDNEGLQLAITPDYACNNHWMNLLQIDNKNYSEDRDSLMQRLDDNGIQTRPVWTLNHKQRPYKDYQIFKIERAEKLVKWSLCLPSSMSLTKELMREIIKLF